MFNFIRGVFTVGAMGAIMLWHVFVEIPLEDMEKERRKKNSCPKCGRDYEKNEELLLFISKHDGCPTCMIEEDWRKS